MTRSVIHGDTPGAFDRGRSPKISGRWLVLARIIWLIVALVCVAIFIANLLPLYRIYAAFGYENDPSPAAVRVGLAQLGFPEWLYVVFRFSSQVAVVLGFMATGVLIFWRRSDDRGALLVSLQLVIFGVLFAVPTDYVPSSPWLNFVVEIIFISFFFGCYWFPNGRFVPRWTRWLLIVWIMSVVGGVFFPGTWLDVDAWSPLIGIPFLMCLAASCIGAQVYRYRRVASPVERQQIKWLMFGFIAAIACFILYNQMFSLVPALSAPGRISALYDLIGGTIQLLSFLLVPLAIGYAMLRYRLYDVDVIIRRTLIYSVLTAMLALVYVGSVVVIQTLLRPLVGTETELATVTSTLAIAALFQPLRRRVQTVIDRRFYRRKYDAQKTLQEFSVKIRDETDLDQLTSDLVQVVDNTLQPSHVSLWLR